MPPLRPIRQHSSRPLAIPSEGGSAPRDDISVPAPPSPLPTQSRRTTQTHTPRMHAELLHLDFGNRSPSKVKSLSSGSSGARFSSSKRTMMCHTRMPHLGHTVSPKHAPNATTSAPKVRRTCDPGLWQRAPSTVKTPSPGSSGTRFSSIRREPRCGTPKCRASLTHSRPRPRPHLPTPDKRHAARLP